MNTCGYQGDHHFCQQGKVAFISRYKDENDYCVSGKRIHVRDGGHVSANATNSEIEAIMLHELDAYATYLQFHAESKVRYGANWPPVEPYSGIGAR